jgi:hypothetical protein
LLGGDDENTGEPSFDVLRRLLSNVPIERSIPARKSRRLWSPSGSMLYLLLSAITAYFILMYAFAAARRASLGSAGFIKASRLLQTLADCAH